MTWENKPVWTEGMFLRPQHFQQFERFVGAQLNGRTTALRAYGWGFDTLEIDDGMLKTGKISLTRARGVFEDGTPFAIPGEVDRPAPIEIDPSLRNAVIYLVLPHARAGAADVALDQTALTEQRFLASEFEAADAVHGQTTRAPLDVARLQVQLKAATEPLDPYTTIPLARVVERRADGSVVLDENFIPTVASHRASSVLMAFVSDVEGMLHQRGAGIAGRLGSVRNASAGNIVDYGTLMLVNGAQSSLRQIKELPVLHPGDLYRELARLAGELATFTLPGKRPVPLPAYDHRAIGTCYEPLIRELRRALNVVMDTPAVEIQLNFNPSDATWKGLFTNPSLLDTSHFVLGVHSSAKPAQIRQHLPNLLKIASPDMIGGFVSGATRAVDVAASNGKPDDLPAADNMTYFDIDILSPYWSQIRAAQAISLHVAANIPDLQLHLWAIRNAQP